MKTMFYGLIFTLFFLFNTHLGAMESSSDIKLYWPDGRAYFLTQQEFNTFKKASLTIKDLVANMFEASDEAIQDIPMTADISPLHIKTLIKFEENLKNTPQLESLLEENKGIARLVELINAANYFDMQKVLKFLCKHIVTKPFTSLKQAVNWVKDNKQYIDQLPEEIQSIVANHIIDFNSHLKSFLATNHTQITAAKPVQIKIFKMASNPKKSAIALTLTDGSIEVREKKNNQWIIKEINQPKNSNLLLWPQWSPDGNYLVLSDGNHYNHIGRYRQNKKKTLLKYTTVQGEIFWSPKGKKFVTKDKSTLQVGLHTKAGWNIEQLKRESLDPIDQIFWSPNGEYFMSVARGSVSIWSYDGKEWIQKLLGITYEKSTDYLLWHPDSTQFAHISKDNMKIFRTTDKQEWQFVQELSYEPQAYLWSYWTSNGTLMLCLYQRTAREGQASLFVWHKQGDQYVAAAHNPYILPSASEFAHISGENALWIARNKSLEYIKITPDTIVVESSKLFSDQIEQLLLSDNGKYLIVSLNNNAVYSVYKNIYGELEHVRVINKDIKKRDGAKKYIFTADNDLIMQESQKYPEAHKVLLRNINLANSLHVYSMPHHEYLTIEQGILLNTLYNKLAKLIKPHIPKDFDAAWATMPTSIKNKIGSLMY